MVRNMGGIDKIVRITAAAGIAALIVLKVVTGVAAVALALLAVVFVVTSSVSFCPLYAPFGIRTCPAGRR